MKAIILHIALFLFIACPAAAQTGIISGTVTREASSDPLSQVRIALQHTRHRTQTDALGAFQLKKIVPGSYKLTATLPGYKTVTQEITVTDAPLVLTIQLFADGQHIEEVVVQAKKDTTFGITRLKDVEGTSIYAGKKSEVIVMDDVTANKATNNTRQIYSKIAGLNIWENDGAGIQLGIGGRGLNPNRVTNFNTRQNGYDMSADALGYPESYYSPPAEAIDRIEIVRGAASLQYGTQFGGLVNFKLKEGPTDKKIQLVSRQTLGSWNFLNSFNSLGGTVKKVNYYVFYQRKSGDGWRPNSEFNVNTAHASVTYKASEKLSISFQYTYMEYLAHQPGGLTDKEFAQDPHQSIRNRNWFKVNWNLGAVLVDYKINSRLKINSRFFGLVASRSALGVLDYINRADPMTQRDLWIDHYTNFGNETRLLYTYSLFHKPAVLLVGSRYYNGYTTRTQGLGNANSGGSKYDFKYVNPDDPEESQYSFPNNNLSFFAENIVHLTSKISLIPGVRFERIQTRANGYYNILNKDLAGNIIYSQRVDEHRVNTRSFVIAGLGLSYKKSANFQAYANFSQNYRAINFNDMRIVNPNLQVDPNLKDEKGYSADAGIRGNASGVFNYDVSVFMISYANRIGTVLQTDPNTFNVYRLRTNISQSRNVGLESFVELDVWKLIRKEKATMKLAVFSNFTYIDARYIHSKEPAYENKKVELAPNVLFKTGINFRKNKWSASYQFAYTSQQFTDASNAVFTSNAINGIIPSYYVMDLSAEFQINKVFTVSGSVNNLLNNHYFTRRADSYPGPGIIPSDARSFFLTVQVKI